MPSVTEIERALRQTASGKSPEKDGIPAEVLSNGGSTLLDHCISYFARWEQESVPHDFKDTLVVHIYKRKGDRAVCDNHRGISLLSIAGTYYGHDFHPQDKYRRSVVNNNRICSWCL